MNKISVNEIFYTIQGEAAYTGTPSVFVRLQGCGVGCPWCDTKHTWYESPEHETFQSRIPMKEEDSYEWASYTVEELADLIDETGVEGCHVVITGGEPLEQDIRGLIEELWDRGHTTQIETSGTEPVDTLIQALSWITVSPKPNMPGGKPILEQAMLAADEIKMPIGKERDVEILIQLLETFFVQEDARVWLQPLSMNSKATELCIKTAKEYGWAVSMQTHKYLGVR